MPAAFCSRMKDDASSIVSRELLFILIRVLLTRKWSMFRKFKNLEINRDLLIRCICEIFLLQVLLVDASLGYRSS